MMPLNSATMVCALGELRVDDRSQKTHWLFGFRFSITFVASSFACFCARRPTSTIRNEGVFPEAHSRIVFRILCPAKLGKLGVMPRRTKDLTLSSAISGSTLR